MGFEPGWTSLDAAAQEAQYREATRRLAQCVGASISAYVTRCVTVPSTSRWIVLYRCDANRHTHDTNVVSGSMAFGKQRPEDAA